jgi:hypothetical protein
VSGAPGERWLHLRIATLHADRLSWLAAADTAASSEPARAPRSLRLPIEVEIGAASVDELRLGRRRNAGAALRGRVHLGASGGTRHRFDDLAAGYDRARRRLGVDGADAPLPVTLDATLSAVDAALPWQAATAADGPLEALAARAQVQSRQRGRAAGTRRDASFDRSPPGRSASCSDDRGARPRRVRARRRRRRSAGARRDDERRRSPRGRRAGSRQRARRWNEADRRWRVWLASCAPRPSAPTRSRYRRSAPTSARPSAAAVVRRHGS